MKTKKRNSPRTEPGGISTFRGQRDEVELAKSKNKHTVLDREISYKSIASITYSLCCKM